MKTSFKIWLESQELHVAQFLEKVITTATDLKKRDIQQGIFKPFVEYIKATWPPNSIQNNQFILPAGYPSGIVSFTHLPSSKYATTVHDSGQFKGFNINILHFDHAKTIQDIDNYLELLKSTMHHEVEHIANIGKDFNQGNDQQAMDYMSNPGEIRAHARQMAYMYSKNFPGQSFDLQKAQSILDQPGFTETHRNYFRKLSNPQIWKNQVHKFGYQHQNPYDQIVPMVQQFLKDYQ